MSLFWVGKSIASVENGHTRIYSYSRASDWQLALLAGILGALLLTGNLVAVVGSGGSWSHGVPSWAWGLCLALLAGLRGAALLINGSWQNGASAIIRATATGLMCLFWTQIAVVSAAADAYRGALSWGTLILLWITWTEMLCTFRAAGDAARIRSARRLSLDHAAVHPR